MALTLASVETAIEGLLTGGQSVTVDGMTYTKASLDGLFKARSYLKTESDRSTRPTIRAFNFGGMQYSDPADSASQPTPVIEV